MILKTVHLHINGQMITVVFVENNGERFCLNHMEAIAVVKVNNIERHFYSKHALTLKAFFARHIKVKKASKFKKKHPSQKAL